MAFSDDLIRAAVADRGSIATRPQSFILLSVLIKRRDAIGRAYLAAINPIVEPQLDAAGTLTFENAATSAGFAAPPAGYRAAWTRFDNTTGDTTPIGESRSSGMTLVPPGPLPDAMDTFIAIDIAAEGAAEPAWTRPDPDVLPPHERRLEAGRPRSPARRARNGVVDQTWVIVLPERCVNRPGVTPYFEPRTFRHRRRRSSPLRRALAARAGSTR